MKKDRHVIHGGTPTYIFPTVKWAILPVFHLPTTVVFRNPDRYDAVACGKAIHLEDGGAVLPLRHATHFARLCYKCQDAAGILIIEPTEESPNSIIQHPDDTYETID